MNKKQQEAFPINTKNKYQNLQVLIDSKGNFLPHPIIKVSFTKHSRIRNLQMLKE